jgi:outer membrane beta-barrel protein
MLLSVGVYATPATDASLEDQLQALDVANQAPAATSKEVLYAVQSRYLPLTHKNEFSVGGGLNLTGDSFVLSEQAEVGYRFHFNDRWAVGLNYALVANQLSSAADRFRSSEGIVPDVPYAKSRTDLLAEYNVFYGKFRYSVDRVFYFDQYIAAGPGFVEMNTGTVGAAVADVGFAFWLSRWGSARIGLKDYYYEEVYRSGTSPTHNLHAHLDIGYLF